MAQWKEACSGDIDLVIKEINSNVTLDDTSIRYKTFDKHETCTSILYDKIKFNKIEKRELEFHEKYQVLNKAIISCLQQGHCTVPYVLKQINENSKQVLGKNKQGYTFHGTFSVRSRSRIPAVHIRGAHITFSDGMPDRFEYPEALMNEISSCSDAFPRDYVHVRITLKARDSYSAYVKSYRIGNVVRGIWNLILNRDTAHFSLGSNIPTNKIVWGPVHTMHYTSGKTVSDSFGREGTWNKSIQSWDITQDLHVLKREEKRIRNSISTCNYRESIEGMIEQYALSLDETYKIIAYRQLWIVLESLTRAHGKREIVRRASFLRRNQRYYRLELEMLTNVRNKIIHEGECGDDYQHYLNRLRGYVEQLLYALILHNNLFSDINDFGGFLDLSHDIEKLTERKEQTSFAIELLRND
jgi:hypothetical protein